MLRILGLFFLPFLITLGMFYLGHYSKFVLKYINKYLLAIILLIVYFLIYYDSLDCETTESPIALECDFGYILSYICHSFYTIGILWSEKIIKLIKKLRSKK